MSSQSKNFTWKIPALIKARAEEIEASAVDCGECPVSMSCALGQDGTGYVFACCGSTGVNVYEEGAEGAGKNGLLIRVMDCAKHNFGAKHVIAKKTPCVLCSGELVSLEEDRAVSNYVYTRTMNSKVSAERRALTFRAFKEKNAPSSSD